MSDTSRGRFPAITVLCVLFLLQGSGGLAAGEQIFVRQPVKALPGGFDSTLMFNSNSPEIVEADGILLSTMAAAGRRYPEAHLDLAFSGRFSVFCHHINRSGSQSDGRTLYLGILAFNPSRKKVRLRVLQAASYLSQPDAPFIALPAIQDNDAGKIFAGPGDRATSDILRGRRQASFPKSVTVPARAYALIAVLPVPVRALNPALNGRSVIIRLASDGPVQLAALSKFARDAGADSPPLPALQDWIALSEEGDLCLPRERTPSPPGAAGQIVYGRVAGVQAGSVWTGRLVDDEPGSRWLTVPDGGQSVSFVLNTVEGGTFGTGQIQSAPLLVRYADTAFAAHGNYAVEYRLEIPLSNSSSDSRVVGIKLQTPVKRDEKDGGLFFYPDPPARAHFRGTVLVSYRDDSGKKISRYQHLVQRAGDKGEDLFTVKLGPGERRAVSLSYIYPPDCTPPQVLTVSAEDARQPDY